MGKSETIKHEFQGAEPASGGGGGGGGESSEDSSEDECGGGPVEMRSRAGAHGQQVFQHSNPADADADVDALGQQVLLLLNP